MSAPHCPEYLSRDERELHQQLNDLESRLLKQGADTARQLNGVLERADQLHLMNQLELLRGNVNDLKIESEHTNRRLEQVQEELDFIRLAVDQEFRKSLTGEAGELLRRARKALR